MRLYLAGTVQYVGIGPRRPVHHQPVLRRPKDTRPPVSPRLLSQSRVAVSPASPLPRCGRLVALAHPRKNNDLTGLTFEGQNDAARKRGLTALFTMRSARCTI